MNARKVAFVEPELQDPGANSVNQPQTVKLNVFKNIYQGAFRDTIYRMVERGGADLVSNLIASAVKGTWIDGIHMVNDTAASQEKPILNRLILVLVSKRTESGQLDLYS